MLFFYFTVISVPIVSVTLVTKRCRKSYTSNNKKKKITYNYDICNYIDCKHWAKSSILLLISLYMYGITCSCLRFISILSIFISRLIDFEESSYGLYDISNSVSFLDYGGRFDVDFWIFLMQSNS